MVFQMKNQSVKKPLAPNQRIKELGLWTCLFLFALMIICYDWLSFPETLDGYIFYSLAVSFYICLSVYTYKAFQKTQNIFFDDGNLYLHNSLGEKIIPYMQLRKLSRDNVGGKSLLIFFGYYSYALEYYDAYGKFLTIYFVKRRKNALLKEFEAKVSNVNPYFKFIYHDQALANLFRKQK